MSDIWSNGARRAAVLLVVGAAFATACDPLKVEDPSRFKDADLDQALDAVANGVEGQFQLQLDGYVIADALLSDVWRHTGTWTDYEDAYQGRYRYGNTNGNGKPDGVMNAWLRTRYAAIDAYKRLNRLAVPDTDPKVIQVKTVQAWVDTYLGEGWCEAPADSGGPAVAQAQMLAQAITEMTAARSLAQQALAATTDAALQAKLTRWVNYTTAGLARANLLAGNFTAANTFAQQVPDGFIEYAKFSTTTGDQNNAIVQLDTEGFNKAAGMRNKWWTQVDTIASRLKDPWTGELDSRVPIRHAPKSLGVDSKTPFYSQWKYQLLGDDIAITHWREMRLIQAEVAWRNNDLPTAMTLMNALRVRSGVQLSNLPDPLGNATTVRNYILSERFAELFMEGHRMPDLFRFNVVAATSGLGAGRIQQFPLSQLEAIWNETIEDNSAQRCQPIS